LDINSGVFWKYLRVYGNKLKPVDRIAASVSMGVHRLDNIGHYLSDSLNKLTLNTVDGVTHIIKPLFIEEISEKLSETAMNAEEYYHCAIYSYILGNKSDVLMYLSKYISYATPERIVLEYINR
jgi:hypothetical protein